MTNNIKNIAKSIFPDSITRSNMLEVCVTSFFEGTEKAMEIGYDIIVPKIGTIRYNKDLAYFLEHKDEIAEKFKDIFSKADTTEEAKAIYKQYRYDLAIRRDNSRKLYRQLRYGAIEYLKTISKLESHLIRRKRFTIRDTPISAYIYLNCYKFTCYGE